MPSRTDQDWRKSDTNPLSGELVHYTLAPRGVRPRRLPPGGADRPGPDLAAVHAAAHPRPRARAVPGPPSRPADHGSRRHRRHHRHDHARTVTNFFTTHFPERRLATPQRNHLCNIDLHQPHISHTQRMRNSAWNVTGEIGNYHSVTHCIVDST